MKLTVETVEQVREVLARGCYQMSPDELPYAAQARAVVVALADSEIQPTPGGRAYVRSHYSVTAEPGARLTIDGRPATLKGFVEQYLIVRMDGDDFDSHAHPTWEVVWTEAAEVTA